MLDCPQSLLYLRPGEMGGTQSCGFRLPDRFGDNSFGVIKNNQRLAREVVGYGAAVFAKRPFDEFPLRRGELPGGYNCYRIGESHGALGARVKPSDALDFVSEELDPGREVIAW